MYIYVYMYVHVYVFIYTYTYMSIYLWWILHAIIHACQWVMSHIWMGHAHVHMSAKSYSVSNSPHRTAKNLRLTVSVFLCTLELTALLLTIFRLHLHSDNLTLVPQSLYIHACVHLRFEVFKPVTRPLIWR